MMMILAAAVMFVLALSGIAAAAFALAALFFAFGLVVGWCHRRRVKCDDVDAFGVRDFHPVKGR